MPETPSFARLINRIRAGDDQAAQDLGRRRLTAEERCLLDLRQHGCSWQYIAVRLGGRSDARRKQLARAGVAHELRLDEDGDE
jgi:hypothetical protein